MSDEYDYTSDHGSDYADDDDFYNEVAGGDDAVSDNEDTLVVPDDPDVGVDEGSDTENYQYESEEETPVDDDEDGEPVDPDEIIEDEEEEVDQPIDYDDAYTKTINIVNPNERTTSHILSRFEMTEIISIRSTQISQFADCMVPIDDLDDPVRQAKRELMARMCPLILVREVGDLKNKETGIMESWVEHWSPNEMQFAVIYTDI
jgi:DNA-directed RNA polymerase subunit K/omega